MPKFDEKLLEALDLALAPDGKQIDTAAFTHFFNIFAETLSHVTEPLEEDDLGPWRDSTLKHKIFDYWETKRPSGAGNPEPWKNKNDLAWILADFASEDSENKDYVETELKDWAKKFRSCFNYGVNSPLLPPYSSNTGSGNIWTVGEHVPYVKRTPKGAEVDRYDQEVGLVDWVLTIPKDVEWEDYTKEIESVEDGSQVMNYRLHYKPTAKVGDRCFVVWRGKVRGWMGVVGIQNHIHGFVCATTGKAWPPGWYLQRSGKFHPVDGPEMQGFRGLRRL